MNDLERDGFAWIRGAYSHSETEAMLRELQAALAADASSVLAGSRGPAYGARNLLRMWPNAIEWLSRCAPLASILREALGPNAGVVRGLYFDKPPGHSWALPWHRDYTIAVKQHRTVPGFAKPTVKAGVPHVEAPEDLLASMLTVRIHLDTMADDNGPLRVVPGSHRHLSEATNDARTLLCDAGDALLMRPLLLHASGHSAADTARHRRIVHLECAPSPRLPGGLEWDRYLRIE
jgi:ectoine hydroxylase-related dioxygenase (phytanoyl-CoA dioxygenase family)